MKQLLENWNRFILKEASYRQVMERFGSSKFLKSSEFNQVDPEEAKQKILETVPENFDVQEKANYLDWRISTFIKTGKYEGPSAEIVKRYYEIKSDEGKKKLLNKINISDINSVEEFEEIVSSAEDSLGEKEKGKKQESTSGEGQNLIYEDENWRVYTPETKGASVALCRGPNPDGIKGKSTRAKWCTGVLTRKYYEVYHKPDNPLIIFISKSDPAEKYQLSYFGISSESPFWNPNDPEKPEFKNNRDKDITGTDVFSELNNIVASLEDKLPERVVNKAKKFAGM